ncbi:hypothetical protein O3G_MSEX002072 [Manduca sexta]|uniref:Uncharacterized protein n=1 Tax=Manduca sexta TaxID=7130 RepID=A0A921YMR6_MANSE|nr:hypothetical protein O3G_MSEX002072 [Manduca sexta]
MLDAKNHSHELDQVGMPMSARAVVVDPSKQYRLSILYPATPRILMRFSVCWTPCSLRIKPK